MNLLLRKAQLNKQLWLRVLLVTGLVFGLWWQPEYVRAQEWATLGDNVYNLNTGNVGIGTTSPTQRFVVSGGGIKNDGYYTPEDGSAGYIGYVVGDFRLISQGTDANTRGSFGFTIRESDRGNPLTPIELQSSGNVVLVGGSGNVGIGTTGPGEKLEVAGNLRMNNSFGLRLLNGRDTYVQPADNTSDAHIFVSQAGIGDFSQLAGNLIIQARTQGTVSRDIIFAGSGTGSVTAPMVTIKGTGNVGIGTTNPNQRLKVYDNMQYNYAADVENASALDVAHGLNIWVNNDGVNSNALRVASTGGDLLVVKANSKVGIGTINPQE